MKTDILIVGAGIVGLTLAQRLLVKHPTINITIIEKELTYGVHASGLNSGVLHAGIYYANDSLKAKFCLNGNRLMREYCLENKLPILELGKVIVTKNTQQLETLDLLYQRAQTNGADVSLIDEYELNQIEPAAKTVQRALLSRTTAIVDPKRIMQTIFEKLSQYKNVTFLFNTRYLGRAAKKIALTSIGKIEYDLMYNVAGAFADRVAHQFDLVRDLRTLPVKGLYRELQANTACKVNGNIYPVPDIRNPFLGVHFTRNIHGKVYVGPTATPCFGRENYTGLRGVGTEAFAIAKRNLALFVNNPQYRSVALTEPRKYLRHFFYRDAKALVKELKPEWLLRTAKVGIRPQLVNIKTHALVTDFVVNKSGHEVHLVNAISPAFTCSWALADYLVDQ